MLKDRKAAFLGLDHREEYFPMVARLDTQAFFALPPEAISPRAPNPVPKVPTNNITSPINCSDHGSEINDEGLANFGGISSDEATDSEEPAEDHSETDSTATGSRQEARPNRTLWPTADRLAWLPLARSSRGQDNSLVRAICPVVNRSMLTNFGHQG